MWEDAFTGECKFRARWLVHSSGLPKDAVLRLLAARQSCQTTERKADQDTTSSNGGASSSEAEKDEVFLTARQEDIPVAMITKPVTLCVAGTPPTTPGPCLTFAYDDVSSDFTPVDDTDPIVARALARQATAAIAPALSGSNGTAVSGWLLPDGGAASGGGGRGNNADGSVSGNALSSARDTETETDSSDGDSVGAEDPVSVGEEDWEMGGQDEDEDTYVSGQGGEFDANNPATTPEHVFVGVEGENCSTSRKSDLSERCPSSTRQSDNGMANDSTQENAAFAPPHGSSCVPGTKANSESSPPPRSRRLAMPPAEGDAAAPAGATNKSPLYPSTRYSMRARQSVGARAMPASKRLFSGKRKRATKPPEEGSESEEEYPPRRTPVGEGFQADIPDLMPAEERETEKAAAAAEESGVPKVVSVPISICGIFFAPKMHAPAPTSVDLLGGQVSVAKAGMWFRVQVFW